MCEDDGPGRESHHEDVHGDAQESLRPHISPRRSMIRKGMHDGQERRWHHQ